VSNKGVFRRFDKAFSVEMQETSFLEEAQGVLHITLVVVYRISAWLAVNRQKKCAKMTILKLLMTPWICFAGNYISNYGLILNTYGARDQNKILMKNFKFFLESAVVKIRPYFLISLSANHTQGVFWWHLNFFIITFIFKIVIFAHFFVN
jgi:hypothetical protein